MNAIATHHWTDNQAQSEESLECGERCADAVWKLFSYDSEARREEGSVAESFNNADDKCESDEHRVAWHAIKQPEQNR
jgi:hypothetical protein